VKPSPANKEAIFIHVKPGTGTNKGTATTRAAVAPAKKEVATGPKRSAQASVALPCPAYRGWPRNMPSIHFIQNGALAPALGTGKQAEKMYINLNVKIYEVNKSGDSICLETVGGG